MAASVQLRLTSLGSFSCAASGRDLSQASHIYSCCTSIALWHGFIGQPALLKNHEIAEPAGVGQIRSRLGPARGSDRLEIRHGSVLGTKPSEPASGLREEGRLKTFWRLFLVRARISSRKRPDYLGPLPGYLTCNSLRVSSFTILQVIEFKFDTGGREDRRITMVKRQIILHRYCRPNDKKRIASAKEVGEARSNHLLDWAVTWEVPQLSRPVEAVLNDDLTSVSFHFIPFLVGHK